MTTALRTDPRRVIRALELADRIGTSPAARELGLQYSTLDRWRRLAAEQGPGWPTQEMVDRFVATQDRRARRARHIAEYRKALILGTHRPAVIDSTGTIRRIRALMRLGWSGDLIAMHGPWQTGDAVLEFSKRDRITRRNAEIVDEIYDLLSMRLGPCEVSRRWAESRGWPPPLAWNDETIDDPAATPVGIGTVRQRHPHEGEVDRIAVEAILAGDWKAPANKATRCEVLRRWDASGRPRAELGRLTGWKPERYGAPVREGVAS